MEGGGLTVPDTEDGSVDSACGEADAVDGGVDNDGAGDNGAGDPEAVPGVWEEVTPAVREELLPHRADCGTVASAGSEEKSGGRCWF